MDQKISFNQEEKEVDSSGTETNFIHAETIKVNEAYVNVIMQEFDVDKFLATRWLKKNDGDLNKTIKWVLQN